MIGYSNALMWIALAAQGVAWTALPLHDTSGGLQGLAPAERTIAAHVLRPQLGPLFQGEGATQMNEAIQSFRAERLNLGGTRALAVQPTGSALCSATGNCAFWIVDLRQRRILLRADDVQQFAVEQDSKHGFPDIITRMHGSAFEGELIRWHFTNARYEPADCATEVTADSNGTPLPQPKITSHPCDLEGN